MKDFTPDAAFVRHDGTTVAIEVKTDGGLAIEARTYAGRSDVPASVTWIEDNETIEALWAELQKGKRTPL